MVDNSDISSGTKKLVRLGLASKGVIYCLIGILAFLTAIGGPGGQTTGSKGIIKWLMEQPYGPFLVAFIAIGLFFYAFWRILRAIKSKENGAKGIVKRLGRAGSGILYATFAVFAGKLVIDSFSGGGSSGSGGGSSQSQYIQDLLQKDWGKIVLIAIGVILIIRSIYLIYMAYTDKYKKKVDSYHIDDQYKSYLIKAGKLGYLARGVVFCVIGYFFIMTVVQHNPSKATQGTGGAMDFIQSTGGTVVMLLIAIGLICYGIFMFMQAKYRDIESVFK